MHDQELILQDESLFSTTHIAYSLGFVPGEPAQAMIAKALVYFQGEMTTGGLWRYWNKEATWGGRKIFSFIPADLDDIANVSYLLRRHGVTFPDNRPFMLHNRDSRGLFYTWLMIRPVLTLNQRYWWTMVRDVTLQRLTAFWIKTEAGYLDTDGVVNANVLLYLGDRPETRAVVDWLTDIVQTGREADCDKWYRDAFSFYYALSRNYSEGVMSLHLTRGAVVDRLRSARTDSGQIGESALQTALAINTLVNFGATEQEADLIDTARDFLLCAQAADGSWSSAPYYYGGPKKSVSWGSAELTTGLCLEALARTSWARISGVNESIGSP